MATSDKPAAPRLTDKQAAFVEQYLQTFNATEAARRAGYSVDSARAIGWENLTKPYIREVIDTRLAEMGMGANEVLARLAEHARGSLDDFLDKDGELNLVAARESGKMHLVREWKRTTTTTTSDKSQTVAQHTEIKLHDPQAALVQLGRYHKLFVDRQESSVKVEITDAKAKLLSRFAASDADASTDNVPGEPVR